jgi:hypothetical protein
VREGSRVRAGGYRPEALQPHGQMLLWFVALLGSVLAVWSGPLPWHNFLWLGKAMEVAVGCYILGREETMPPVAGWGFCAP